MDSYYSHPVSLNYRQNIDPNIERIATALYAIAWRKASTEDQTQGSQATAIDSAVYAHFRKDKPDVVHSKLIHLLGGKHDIEKGLKHATLEHRDACILDALTLASRKNGLCLVYATIETEIIEAIEDPGRR
jgi:hypothetical protein